MKRVIMIAAGTVIILACIIFSIPFIIIPSYSVETYKDTEIKQEQYTVPEPYTQLEKREYEEIIFQDKPYSVPFGISIPFSIVKADTKLIGSYQLPAAGGFYLYSSTGRILYEQLGDRGSIEIPLLAGNYSVLVRERASWQERISIDLRLKWTEQIEVTKCREVTKFREVPVIIEKERVITSDNRVSLWQVFFK